jgi:L-ascorbate 6-phosphate lactonase
MSGMQVTWLGQAGFLLEHARTRVLVDPFLSLHEARLFPAPEISSLGHVDWLLITHDHVDHLDLESLPDLVAANPELRMVLPQPSAHAVEELIAAEHVSAVQPGDVVELGPGLSAETITAIHATDVKDGYSDGSEQDGRARFVGYLIASPSLTVYHSGDTIVTPALLDALGGKRIDVALLPINGRDFFREEQGFVGNLNAREAVELASRLGARILVPMHWDLFAGNTEQPSVVLDEIVRSGARLHVLTLDRLRPFQLL